MKNPSKIVETKNGLKGIVYNKECATLKKGDKIPVHVLPEAPGLPDKLLCNASDLKVIGFID